MAECKCDWSYTIATWNSGEPFDYRNVLLRTGKSSSDPEIKRQYDGVQPLYAAAMAVFEEKANQNKSAPVNHRDHPRCQVPIDQAAFISDSRLKKIKQSWKKIFDKADIMLFQEVMPDEIPVLKEDLSKKFDLCVGKDFEREKDCFDTVVAWNRDMFTKIEPTGNETVQRRFTMVQLRDNRTQKIVLVSSLHARGFNIANPSQGLEEGQFLSSDQDVVDMLIKGNKFAEESHIKIFGGDFNSEHKKQIVTRNDALAQHRFKLMEEEGFIHIDNEIPTSFNKALTEVSGRENGLCTLDYLFVRYQGNWQGKHCNENCEPLEDLSKNPSDHRPVLAIISGQ